MCSHIQRLLLYNATKVCLSITIMWSTCGSVRSTGPVDINHFVPLLPRSVLPSASDSVIDVDEVAGRACVEDADVCV